MYRPILNTGGLSHLKMGLVINTPLCGPHTDRTSKSLISMVDNAEPRVLIRGTTDGVGTSKGEGEEEARGEGENTEELAG